MRMEAEQSNGVHHVVWCVEPENLDRVRVFWEQAIGLSLDELDLPELGLRVLISWSGGVEIMSPIYASGEMAEAARRFLDERGEGVYSVVCNVSGIEDVITTLTERGGRLLFRETISPEAVEARGLSEGEPFSILQAGFDDDCGMRICLQEIVPGSSSPSREGG
jgi:4-hydroxyphenylpyruvate dioxygenase-like putative hemolysin